MTIQTYFKNQEEPKKAPLALAQRSIERNFPKLKISAISFAGEGMDSWAFEVNNELIFRFP